MWLLIDDERDLGCDLIARNAEVGKVVLGNSGLRGLIEYVCFDHDLGHGETGYDVLVWALERGFLPDKIQIVTSNPVGREMMEAALVHAGYKKVDATWFKEGSEARKVTR